MGVYCFDFKGICGDYFLCLCAGVPLWHERRVAGISGGGVTYHGGDGDGAAEVSVKRKDEKKMCGKYDRFLL